MDSQDTQVLAAVRRWAAAGHRSILVTVARTWGSAPRPPGAWMVLRDDGLVQGSVSGGCIETDLIDRLLDGGFDQALPFVQRYGVTQEEARRYGLLLRRHHGVADRAGPDLAALNQLADLIAAGQLVERTVRVGQPGVTVAPGSAGDSLSWDGQALTTLHGPAWRLLIVGAGQISRYLAQMAQARLPGLHLRPARQICRRMGRAGATLVAGMPDDAVLELAPRSA